MTGVDRVVERTRPRFGVRRSPKDIVSRAALGGSLWHLPWSFAAVSL